MEMLSSRCYYPGENLRFRWMPDSTPDIAKAVEDPKYARKFVSEYKWDGEPPKYIVWGIDQKVYLHDMSDAEAVFVAKTILREIEIPRAATESKLERWEQ